MRKGRNRLREELRVGQHAPPRVRTARVGHVSQHGMNSFIAGTLQEPLQRAPLRLDLVGSAIAGTLQEPLQHVKFQYSCRERWGSPLEAQSTLAHDVALIVQDTRWEGHQTGNAHNHRVHRDATRTSNAPAGVPERTNSSARLTFLSRHCTPPCDAEDSAQGKSQEAVAGLSLKRAVAQA